MLIKISVNSYIYSDRKCDKLNITYVINNVYETDNLENQKEIFNKILSKIIKILESYEEDF